MRRKLIVSSGLMVLAMGAWLWFGPLRTWGSIERVRFDPGSAREVLAATRAGQPTPGTTEVLRIPPAARSTDAVPHAGEPADQPEDASVPTPPTLKPAPPEPVASLDEALPAVPDPDLDVFLILGSDEKPTDPDIRADAIMLLIVPESRSASMLISIPRLLLVSNPCTGQPAPINTYLEGCGEVSGFDLMGVAVEDYSGLDIDHLVLFDFAGFETIIDRIGGLEVCVEHAVKIYPNRPVLLEPGCSVLNGEQSLAWARSRQAVERIDGEWRLIEEAGDAGRTARQRHMVRQVMDAAGRFGSPGALLDLATELSDSFALDDGLSLREAIAVAWELRAVRIQPTFDVGVSALGSVSPEGEFVLIPDQPFSFYLETLLGHG